MRYTITGDTLQFVNIEIAPGEDIMAAGGAVAYTTGNVTMDTKIAGGILKGIKKSISGNAALHVKFRSHGGTGIVGLGGSIPGKIIDLDTGVSSWIIQKTSYLGSEASVRAEDEYQKKSSSQVFGNEGLVLQKVSGTGMVFIASGGDFYFINLKAGQQYKVSTPKALAWEDSVKFDIASVGGAKATMFGSDGLFVTTLTGPGKIIIQSMSTGELAVSLSSFIANSK